MKVPDPWHQLRAGEFKAGLKQLHTNYVEDPSASSIMELGVAYLWASEYETAWEFFWKSIAEYPESLSGFYGMAGTSRWCLGDVPKAVQLWSAGLDAQMADTNGLGIHLPLLLWMTSILKPGCFSRGSAEKLLKVRVKDRRVITWPGPIAQWVLGEIGEAELIALTLDDDTVETHDKEWLTNFYQAVIHYGKSRCSKFLESIQKLTDTTRPEWADADFFLARMWSEEFFIARHEASKF
jgi:hypothetical protein